MVAHSAELVEELKLLRKGRGIYVPQITERVGPALREACGAAPTDNPGDLRRKVASCLEEHAAGLPQDLQVAVLAALAIHQEARLPFYQDRIRWVARYLDRDERTARRRVDDGMGQLAELVVSSANGVMPAFDLTSPGWRVEELRSIVLLDGPVTEVIELRRIVVERSSLEQLDLAFTLPRDPGSPDPVTRDLLIDVLYGGTLARRMLESSERFGFVLQLPRRLERRDTHEYGLRFRIPEGQRRRPHYTCVSKWPYDHFDLRVRFGPGEQPRQVWKVTDAFQRDVDDPIPNGEQLALDAAGELHLTFRHLTPGLAYGVRWQET
jgi:hypothetical protein